MHTPLSDHFKNKLAEYVKLENRVAELYHGEWPDILQLLAQCVGPTGMVYGVDKLNPFPHDPQMRVLDTVPQIKLFKHLLPPLPEEVKNLDTIIIREFIWTFPVPYTGAINPLIYQAIDGALNSSGHLILHLNWVEQENEHKSHALYQRTIATHLPQLVKIYHQEDVLAYRKN